MVVAHVQKGNQSLLLGEGLELKLFGLHGVSLASLDLRE